MGKDVDGNAMTRKEVGLNAVIAVLSVIDPAALGAEAAAVKTEANALKNSALIKISTEFSQHSIERLGQRGVSKSMARAAISKGQKFYDPLNKPINYILPNGFASGKSLLVGTNLFTGEVTTVIRSSKNLIKPRMIPIK